MLQTQIKTVNFRKVAFIIGRGNQKVDRFFTIQKGKIRIINKTEIFKDEEGILKGGNIFAVVSPISSQPHRISPDNNRKTNLIEVKREQ